MASKPTERELKTTAQRYALTVGGTATWSTTRRRNLAQGFEAGYRAALADIRESFITDRKGFIVFDDLDERTAP